MATLETVYLKDGKLRLNVAMRPSGNFWLDVELPPNFADCIYKIAQAAADKREQEMRAEILGEQHVA